MPFSNNYDTRRWGKKIENINVEKWKILTSKNKGEQRRLGFP